jgi:hypothetical protein
MAVLLLFHIYSLYKILKTSNGISSIRQFFANDDAQYLLMSALAIIVGTAFYSYYVFIGALGN